MPKLLVLDLDDTVAPIGKPASEYTANALRDFEKRGYGIVLCSGKPTYYLVGFSRQLGLRAPILIGENGAQTVYGIGLPPVKVCAMPVTGEQTRLLDVLKKEIGLALGGDVWFQPNLTALTPFPAKKEGFAAIEEILDRYGEEIKKADVNVYPQSDCFDILPASIDKGAALRALMARENAARGDVTAVGNGINDLPMLACAGRSIGIGNALSGKADVCFGTIEEALKEIAFKSGRKEDSRQ